MVRLSILENSLFPIHRLIPSHFSGRSFSRDVDFSLEKPQPWQLEHVQTRLIETTPEFFRQRIDFTFYSPEVIIDNQLTGQKIHGRDNWMKHCGQLAVAGKFLLPHVEMSVVDCYPSIEDASVRLRWRIKYISFFRLFMDPRLFKREHRLQNLSWCDGLSIFTVNGNGDVHYVSIQKTEPDESQKKLYRPDIINEKIKNVINHRGSSTPTLFRREIKTL